MGVIVCGRAGLFLGRESCMFSIEFEEPSKLLKLHCSVQDVRPFGSLAVTKTCSNPWGLTFCRPCLTRPVNCLSKGSEHRIRIFSIGPEFVTRTVIPFAWKDLFIKASSALTSPALAASFRESDIRDIGKPYSTTLFLRCNISNLPLIPSATR